METALPTVQKVGRTLSTTIIDPLIDAFNTFVDTSFALHAPRANVTEKDSEIRIELAAPGLQKDDFKINIDGSVLTISAEKENSRTEGEEAKNYRREYNYSSFSRSFMLPESAQTDQTKATYKDGILTITVDKADMPPKESKAITVD